MNEKDFYASLGVPLSAISNSDITSNVEQVDFVFGKKNKDKVTITTRRQLSCFESMKKHPKDGLYCIYSTSSICQKIACFSIFKYAIARAFKKKTSMPYWHIVTSDGFGDKVSRKELLQNPSLLVIDGLTDKSSQVKTELVRDIIARYSNIPVVLLVRTTNLNSFNSKTYIQPNRFLWLAESEKGEREI